MRQRWASRHVRLGFRAAVFVGLAIWLGFPTHPNPLAVSAASSAFIVLALFDFRAAAEARRDKWEAEAHKADLEDSAAREAELKAAQDRAAELG